MTGRRGVRRLLRLRPRDESPVRRLMATLLANAVPAGREPGAGVYNEKLGMWVFLLTENQSTYIGKTQRHRLENPGRISHCLCRLSCLQSGF